jgi:hypothetical protein
MISFLKKHYRTITGISHICLILTPENEDNKDQIGIKKALAIFFQWFLRNKYLRYIMKEGKMTNQQKYLEFKNQGLLYMISSLRK